MSATVGDASGPSFEERREALRATLGEHYAHERILEEDYERRLELLEAAGDDVDLQAIVADLPTFDDEGRRVMTPYPQGSSEALVSSQGQALASRGTQALAPSGLEPLALSSSFGTVQRRGEWDAPQQITINVSFGEGKLDFRQARLQPGVTEVMANASFGAIKITVPPELPVSCVGTAVMGDFATYTRSAEGLAEDAPRLRIDGKAFMGEVKVVARKRPN